MYVCKSKNWKYYFILCIAKKKRKNENVAVRIRNLNKVFTCSTKKSAENNVTSNLSKLIDNLSSR